MRRRNLQTGEERRTMREKHVEVVGGEYISGEDEAGNPLPPVFVQGRRKDPARKGQILREVVRESKLSALFRQDWELCGAEVIRIRETNSPTTVVQLDW